MSNPPNNGYKNYNVVDCSCPCLYFQSPQYRFMPSLIIILFLMPNIFDSIRHPQTKFPQSKNKHEDSQNQYERSREKPNPRATLEKAPNIQIIFHPNNLNTPKLTSDRPMKNALITNYLKKTSTVRQSGQQKRGTNTPVVGCQQKQMRELREQNKLGGRNRIKQQRQQGQIQMGASASQSNITEQTVLQSMSEEEQGAIENMWLVGEGKSDHFLVRDNLVKYDHHEWAHIVMNTPWTPASIVSEFSIKVVRTKYQHIYIGLATQLGLYSPCADHCLDDHTSLFSSRFYRLRHRKYLLACYREGDVVRVIVDWKKEVVYWMVNDHLIRREELPAMRNYKLYPCIQMQTPEDIIEWVQ